MPSGLRSDAIERCLTWSEADYAGVVGFRRQLRALREGWTGAAGQRKEDLWGDGIEGAAGEYAGCLEFDLEWNEGLVGPLKDERGVKLADALDADVEFKTRSQTDWDLLVRPYELVEERAYVLVVGVVPRYWVQGYLLGWEVRQYKVTDPTGKGRDPAWFVPAGELHSAESLREWVEVTRPQGKRLLSGDRWVVS